jgi:hypothetical protein
MYHENEMKDDAMGKACCTHGREAKRVPYICQKTRRKGTTCETYELMGDNKKIFLRSVE